MVSAGAGKFMPFLPPLLLTRALPSVPAPPSCGPLAVLQPYCNLDSTDRYTMDKLVPQNRRKPFK